MSLTLVQKKTPVFRILTSLVLAAFLALQIFPGITRSAHAQTTPLLNLPAPGTMVPLSPGFIPPEMKGIKLFPDQPLRFDFIVDTGDSQMKQPELKGEADRLIKYFMASLTIPEEDLWVNLSPYEKDRIIDPVFGQTEMGRDMLAQDYLLKQITSSLLYPEDTLGQTFWNKVYARAQELYGTTEIPVNTFNKVWIVPDKAVVYEHGDTAFVAESRLKVMMEEDYIAQSAERKVQSVETYRNASLHNNVSTAVMKEIVIPALEKEVNEGEHFAQLRQIYNALILATWFKRNLKESLLGRTYVSQKKIVGVDVEDKAIKEKIYQRYLDAFKVGVYDYIKEDYDPATDEYIPRQYFSGGMAWTEIPQNSEFVDFPTIEAYARAVKNTVDGKTFVASAYLRESHDLLRNQPIRKILDILAQETGVAWNEEEDRYLFEEALMANPGRALKTTQGYIDSVFIHGVRLIQFVDDRFEGLEHAGGGGKKQQNAIYTTPKRQAHERDEWTAWLEEAISLGSSIFTPEEMSRKDYSRFRLRLKEYYNGFMRGGLETQTINMSVGELELLRRQQEAVRNRDAFHKAQLTEQELADFRPSILPTVANTSGNFDFMINAEEIYSGDEPMEERVDAAINMIAGTLQVGAPNALSLVTRLARLSEEEAQRLNYPPGRHLLFARMGILFMAAWQQALAEPGPDSSALLEEAYKNWEKSVFPKGISKRPNDKAEKLFKDLLELAKQKWTHPISSPDGTGPQFSRPQIEMIEQMVHMFYVVSRPGVALFLDKTSHDYFEKQKGLADKFLLRDRQAPVAQAVEQFLFLANIFITAFVVDEWKIIANVLRRVRKIQPEKFGLSLMEWRGIIENLESFPTEKISLEQTLENKRRESPEASIDFILENLDAFLSPQMIYMLSPARIKFLREHLSGLPKEQAGVFTAKTEMVSSILNFIEAVQAGQIHKTLVSLASIQDKGEILSGESPSPVILTDNARLVAEAQVKEGFMGTAARGRGHSGSPLGRNGDAELALFKKHRKSGEQKTDAWVRIWKVLTQQPEHNRRLSVLEQFASSEPVDPRALIEAFLHITQFGQGKVANPEDLFSLMEDVRHLALGIPSEGYTGPDQDGYTSLSNVRRWVLTAFEEDTFLLSDLRGHLAQYIREHGPVRIDLAVFPDDDGPEQDGLSSDFSRAAHDALRNEPIRRALETLAMVTGIRTDETTERYPFKEDVDANGRRDIVSFGRYNRPGYIDKIDIRGVTLYLFVHDIFKGLEHSGRGTYQNAVYTTQERLDHEISEWTAWISWAIDHKEEIFTQAELDAEDYNHFGLRLREYLNGFVPGGLESQKRDAFVDETELLRRQQEAVELRDSFHRQALVEEKKESEFRASIRPTKADTSGEFDFMINADDEQERVEKEVREAIDLISKAFDEGNPKILTGKRERLDQWDEFSDLPSNIKVLMPLAYFSTAFLLSREKYLEEDKASKKQKIYAVMSGILFEWTDFINDLGLYDFPSEGLSDDERMVKELFGKANRVMDSIFLSELKAKGKEIPSAPPDAVLGTTAGVSGASVSQAFGDYDRDVELRAREALETNAVRVIHLVEMALIVRKPEELDLEKIQRDLDLFDKEYRKGVFDRTVLFAYHGLQFLQAWAQWSNRRQGLEGMAHILKEWTAATTSSDLSGKMTKKEKGRRNFIIEWAKKIVENLEIQLLLKEMPTPSSAEVNGYAEESVRTVLDFVGLVSADGLAALNDQAKEEQWEEKLSALGEHTGGASRQYGFCSAILDFVQAVRQDDLFKAEWASEKIGFLSKTLHEIDSDKITKILLFMKEQIQKMRRTQENIIEQGPTGGIDFDPAGLNIETGGSGMDADVFLSGADTPGYDVDGYTAVIFNVTQITNLPLWLAQ